MATSKRFHVLFSDIGGVLGNNGWDTALRRDVCEHFGIAHESIDGRHRLLFDSYERGHIRFEDYLKTVFFAEPRAFAWQEVRDFVYNASTPWPENIAFFLHVKNANRMKIALISNEGQGITEHRITKFGLRDLADFIVMSYFTGMRKPDPAIWKLAVNLAAVDPEDAIYVDDRAVFAEIAGEMGFASVHHTSLEATRDKLASLGLRVP